MDQNAEASASSSQLASTGKLVALKSRTVLDQQKEREVKNEDDENHHQAGSEKLVTLKMETWLFSKRDKKSNMKTEEMIKQVLRNAVP